MEMWNYVNYDESKLANWDALGGAVHCGGGRGRGVCDRESGPWSVAVFL